MSRDVECSWIEAMVILLSIWVAGLALGRISTDYWPREQTTQDGRTP